MANEDKWGTQTALASNCTSEWAHSLLLSQEQRTHHRLYQEMWLHMCNKDWDEYCPKPQLQSPTSPKNLKPNPKVWTDILSPFSITYQPSPLTLEPCKCYSTHSLDLCRIQTQVYICSRRKSIWTCANQHTDAQGHNIKIKTCFQPAGGTNGRTFEYRRTEKNNHIFSLSVPQMAKDSACAGE